MKNPGILPICLLLMIGLQAHCQVADKNDDPTLKESVDDLKASIKSVGNLFKKKDKDKKESPVQEDESGGGVTDNGIPVSTGSANYIQGGKITADVVYLDADRFTNFN